MPSDDKAERSPPLSERAFGIVSTARSGLRRAPRNLKETRDFQPLQLADGGTAWLSWWWAPGYSSSPPATILLCPGLNNNSHLPFVQHAVAMLLRRNFTVAVFDYRATVGPLTSARLFGADSWADLPEVVEAVRKRSPYGSRLFGVGHSMGGSMLVKYASVAGANCPLHAIATISSPYSLSAHQKRLESSLSWRLLNLITSSAARLSLYRLWLTEPRSRQHLTSIKWWDLLTAMSLRELEAATICPMNGFSDPEQYYAFATADLERIEVPLLAMHARDDPVIGIAELPLAELRARPRITLVLTDRGGHLGYFGSDEGARLIDEHVGTFLERQRDSDMPVIRARL